MNVFRIYLKAVWSGGLYIVASPNRETAKQLVEKHFFAEHDEYDWIADAMEEEPDRTRWSFLSTTLQVKKLSRLVCSYKEPTVIEYMFYTQ